MTRSSENLSALCGNRQKGNTLDLIAKYFPAHALVVGGAGTLLGLVLAGCAPMLSQVPDFDAGTHTIRSTARLRGDNRKYRLHMPPSCDGERQLPLVVAIHGSFSKARLMEWESGWSVLADREGFIVAYPEGFGIFGLLQHWNAGHCCGKAAEDNFDDVGFIDCVVDELIAELPVDRRRIYVTGFSNGGMLTHRYAAERSERIAAAAPVAGAVGGRADTNRPIWVASAPRVPVPILIMHGHDDAAVPYEGGRRVDRRSPREYLSVHDSAAFWRKHNHTQDPCRRETLHAGAVVVQTWQGKPNGADVVLYSIRGWGHEWPGPRQMEKLRPDHPLSGFDGAQVIWNFFKRYTRSSVRPETAVHDPEGK
jgi:polyhydroxybutyrate depolymerase